MRRQQAGFTLVELAMVSLIVGLLSAILSGHINSFFAISNAARALDQEHKNRLIAQGLYEWAKAFNVGVLPPPYTNPAINHTNAVVDPVGVTPELLTLLQEKGLDQREINGDGRQAERARVLQVANGLSTTTPLFGLTGDLVTVAYQIGAVYLTDCQRDDLSCNPNPLTGLPGESPALTAANYQTWTTVGSDTLPARVSTLPLMREQIAVTAFRLNTLRDQMRRYFYSLQAAGSPGADVNYYPRPTGLSENFENPATNQGCVEGWFDLSDPSIDVLALIGLGQAEFGVTSFGASVEYCRDYAPTASSSAVGDTAPHLAAFRIHRLLTNRVPPDDAVIGNNVILPI